MGDAAANDAGELSVKTKCPAAAGSTSENSGGIDRLALVGASGAWMSSRMPRADCCMGPPPDRCRFGCGWPNRWCQLWSALLACTLIIAAFVMFGLGVMLGGSPSSGSSRNIDQGVEGTPLPAVADETGTPRPSTHPR